MPIPHLLRLQASSDSLVAKSKPLLQYETELKKSQWTDADWWIGSPVVLTTWLKSRRANQKIRHFLLPLCSWIGRRVGCNFVSSSHPETRYWIAGIDHVVNRYRPRTMARPSMKRTTRRGQQDLVVFRCGGRWWEFMSRNIFCHWLNTRHRKGEDLFAPGPWITIE